MPPEGEHDRTGLDLAADIAAQTARSAPILPPIVDRPAKKRQYRPRQFVEQRSSAHPDDRDPQLLGAVLDRVSSKRGWRKQISLAMVLRDWRTVVGDQNAEHSEPVGFADGVLTVRCDSTAWATGMKYSASQIVAKLNEALGQQTVTKVTILGPQAPSWKKGRRSVRDGRGPRDTYG